MKNEIRSEITRQCILGCAAALFAEHGYAAAGVAEICSAAQVSKGAFYHHFSSKNALFVELLNQWLNGLDQRLEAVSAQDIPFPQMLSSMAAVIDDVYAAYCDQVLILFEFWMQASREPGIWEAVVQPFQRYETYFARMIEKGIQEGSLAEVDPQAGARTLISLAVGLLLQGMLYSQTSPAGHEPGGFNGAQPAQNSISILLQGLKRSI